MKTDFSEVKTQLISDLKDMDIEFTPEEKAYDNQIDVVISPSGNTKASEKLNPKSRRRISKLKQKCNKWLEKEKTAIKRKTIREDFVKELQRLIDKAVEIKERKKNIKILKKLLINTKRDLAEDAELKKIKKTLRNLEIKTIQLENKIT